VERERVVQTSSGDITVGMLQWSGYKRIKAGILLFIGEKLARIIQEAFGGLPGGVRLEPSAIATRVIPALACEIGGKIDEACIDILEACGVPRARLEELPAIDIVLLREAAYELNSIERLIDAEKNLLAGLVGKALKTAGFNPQSLKSFGGPGGSHSSPGPDGSDQRSSEPQ
jgi:hypothetical protein